MAGWLLALALLGAGCGGPSEAPRSVVKEEPEAVAGADFVTGRGRGLPPADLPQGQARMAAERAARMAALRDASARAVEAGGSSVVARFEVLSTTWARDGSSVEVVLKAPVQKP